MIRDKGPINNLGFGKTSRDFVPDDDERSGPSAQSGFISRALDGHPVAKMATAMLATGIAASMSGKFVRQGGLKLRS